MSSLIFSHSKSIVNKAKKAARKAADTAESIGQDYRTAYELTYNTIMKSEMSLFREYLEVSKQLHSEYIEFSNPSKQSYFITIRPDDSKCSITDFIVKVESFMKRKCFISYSLSYEQKGTSIEDLGKGFHVHIVADMKQASKGQVLRDCLSSWNDWIEKGLITKNNIDVRTTKNPDKIVDDYLIEYKSDDGHKEVTKDMDYLWRSNNNIENIYRSSY